MKKSDDKNIALMGAGVLGWLVVFLITQPSDNSLLTTNLYYIGFSLFIVGYLCVDWSLTKRIKIDSTVISIGLQLIAYLIIVFTTGAEIVYVLLVMLAGQLPFYWRKKTSIITLSLINSLTVFIFYYYWQHSFNQILLNGGTLLAFQIFAFAVSEIAVREKLLSSALILKNAELVSTRALLEQTTRQSERLQLSRDLHDICGHQLMALILNLEYLTKTASPEQQAQLTETNKVAKALLQQIRDVVRQNKTSSNLDLNVALNELFNALPGVEIEFINELPDAITSNSHAETLLRICQEAITNAVKHGKKQSIKVRLAMNENQLILTVDNQINDSKKANSNNGLGNMKARAKLLHGDVQVSFPTSTTWRINAFIPLEEPAYD